MRVDARGNGTETSTNGVNYAYIATHAHNEVADVDEFVSIKVEKLPDGSVRVAITEKDKPIVCRIQNGIRWVGREV